MSYASHFLRARNRLIECCAANPPRGRVLHLPTMEFGFLAEYAFVVETLQCRLPGEK